MDRLLFLKEIAEARLAYILLNWKNNWDNTTMTPQDVAKTLIKVLESEFGYHKVDLESLPMLSDEDIEELKEKAEELSWSHKVHPQYEQEKYLLEAQLDLIKEYL